MARLNDLISEDTNQFGPGTDLMVSLLAVMLVMIVISGQLYNKERARSSEADGQQRQERAKNDELRKAYEEQKRRLAALEEQLKKMSADGEGNILPARLSIPAADFSMNPVDRLRDPEHAKAAVESIVQQYLSVQNVYPFIFVVGHANHVDAETTDYKTRQQRNWDYAGRRAGVIADLIQARLSPEQRERIVVMSAGEFDMRAPGDPNSPVNAFVEVIFGKTWKPPAGATRRATP
jgi:hypothetical protein